VDHAARAGIDTLGLVDHDTLAGVAEAAQVGADLGVRVVSGCEFSVAAPWGEMHLLGYFLPPDDPALTAFLEDQRSKRLHRAERMVDRLRGLGQEVTLDDVLVESGEGAVGRPHVARALVKRGGVSSVSQAFVRFLRWGRPAFVPKILPSVEEVTAIVRAVGGVSSAAHLGERATEPSLVRLRAQGLDAVEVRHPAHNEMVTSRIDGLADETGLLKTGGTDWHGPGEEAERAPLGAIAVPAAWLQRLESLHAERVLHTEEGE